MDKKIFKWKKLGEVGVDGGIIIVSDAENSLNKNNLSNNDKILLYDCVTPKLDKLTNR